MREMKAEMPIIIQLKKFYHLAYHVRNLFMLQTYNYVSTKNKLPQRYV